MNRSLLIIWGITIIIAAALGIFVIWPSIQQDLETIEQTKKAQVNINDFEQRKLALLKLSKDSNLDNLSNKVKEFVPEDEEAGELILILTDIAQNVGLVVDQASFNQKSGDNQIAITDATATGFQLKVSGEFQNIIGFLSSIERANRLVIVQSLRLSQKDDAFILDMNGSAYSKKKGQTIPSLENLIISPESLKKIEDLQKMVAKDFSNLANPF